MVGMDMWTDNGCMKMNSVASVAEKRWPEQANKLRFLVAFDNNNLVRF